MVGAVFEFGSVTVTEPEIIAFARQFDPQTMHTDPEAAAKGPTGGLIASGWHTIAMMMRMYADHYLPENGLPAPGSTRCAGSGRFGRAIRSACG